MIPAGDLQSESQGSQSYTEKEVFGGRVRTKNFIYY